jgi:hypothetical protein
MKTLNALMVAAALAATSLAAHAEDDGMDPAKVAAFENRVFAGPVGEKASACFVRRYDARHLALHPRQKVAAMKLLVTVDKVANEPTSYGYRIGVQYRNKPGDFDGGSSCGLMVGEDGKKEIRFSCDVDCGGGGIEVAISKDNKSMILHLEAIAVWDRKHPDGETESLQGGKDDKVFRLDRVDPRECTELLTDNKTVASLQPE